MKSHLSSTAKELPEPMYCQRSRKRPSSAWSGTVLLLLPLLVTPRRMLSIWMLFAATGHVIPIIEVNAAGEVYSRSVLANEGPAQSVFWLHIPKCGTSFGVTAASYPRQHNRSPFPLINKKWRHGDIEHQAIPQDADTGVLRSVVSMFREPEQRRLSAYTWKKQNPGCCLGDWGWSKEEEERVRAIAKSARLDSEGSDGSYAVEAMANFTGCQVRMVLGYGCHSHRPTAVLSKAEVDSAIIRMREFRFVGIMEEWRLSVCLFNAITTGERFITRFQLSNSRPSNGQASQKFIVPPQMPVDRADAAFYEAVKQRFWEEVEFYNISEAACINLGEPASEDQPRKLRNTLNRAAVMVAGELRAFAFPSVRRNFFESIILPLADGGQCPPDTFYHLSTEESLPCWKVLKGTTNSNTKNTACQGSRYYPKHTEPITEKMVQALIHRLLSPQWLLVQSSDDLEKRHRGNISKANPRSFGDLFWRFYDLYNVMVEHERYKRNGTQYEVIIRTRPDLIYRSRLDVHQLVYEAERRAAGEYAIFQYDFFAIFSRRAAQHGLTIIEACGAEYWACSLRYEMNIQAYLRYKHVRLFSIEPEYINVLSTGTCTSSKSEPVDQCTLIDGKTVVPGCSWDDNNGDVFIRRSGKLGCGEFYRNFRPSGFSLIPFQFKYRRDDVEKINKHAELRRSIENELGKSIPEMRYSTFNELLGYHSENELQTRF